MPDDIASPGVPTWIRRLRHHDLWLVRWWPLLVPGALVLGAALLVGALFTVDYAAATVPLAGDAIEAPTVVLDVHGEELGKLDPAVVGEQVTADELPDHVVDAVLAAEDRTFRSHGGFSVRGTLRAAWANLRSRQMEQGASTITQQYIDLTTEGSGRSPREKVREIATAARLERSLTKPEILDRYLNLVPFGRDAVGIDTAARVYFRVPAAELDVNQAATLAGMIAAPSAFDPERHPDGAQRRRDVVLAAMADAGWLDRAEADQVIGTDLPEVSSESLVQYGDAAYVIDAVRRELGEELGPEGLGRGLVVQTTIDARMQELAQQTLREHVEGRSWTGAVVSIDPATGAVRALVGGANFAEESYNAAIRARRQPGSAFKPFTLAAFVEAGYAPDRSRFDGPAELEVETATEDVVVHNFGDAAFRDISVREATQRSVNTVYMQMIDEVGVDAVTEVANDMGIRADLPAVPSIALGSGSVTPLEMASAYATLAARGVHRTPVLVSSVTHAGGEVAHETEGEEYEALPAQTAGVVTDVLADVVVAGTGTAAQIEHPVAGKTGTTNDSRDAWFVGYTAQLATAVWVGNADNSSMGDVTGGSVAAPLWGDYMAQVMEPLDPVDLPVADQDGLEGLDEAAPPPPPPPPPSPSPTPTETATSTTEPSPTPSTSATTESEPSPTPTATTEPEPSPTPTSDETAEPSPSPSP